MMRTVVIKLICVLALGSGSAVAQGPQNREISFMAGPVPATSQTFPNSDISVSTATGVAFQYSFANQVYSNSTGALYIEVPMNLSFSPEGVIRGGSGKASRHSFLFTPGVRFQVQLQSRLLIYGVAGGGYGGFRRVKLDDEFPTRVVSSSTLRGAFVFGGGIDMRLSRLVSLRAEVRDFVGGSGLSGTQGRHLVLPLMGLALHF